MARYDISRAWFKTPNGRAAVMHIREGTNDWNTCQGAMNEDEYGLRGRTLSGLALDIGAHFGAVTIGMLLDNPDLFVEAVEPIPGNIDLLIKNADINGVGARLIIHEAAAGDGAPVTIRYAYEDNENDLHHAYIGNSGLVEDPTRVHQEANVPTLTPFSWPGAAFVKIDCEGGEWPFFSAGGMLPVLYPEIVGEWHNVEGHKRADLAPLLPGYDLTFTGPVDGPGGFRAVAK